MRKRLSLFLSMILPVRSIIQRKRPDSQSAERLVSVQKILTVTTLSPCLQRSNTLVSIYSRMTQKRGRPSQCLILSLMKYNLLKRDAQLGVKDSRPQLFFYRPATLNYKYSHPKTDVHQGQSCKHNTSCTGFKSKALSFKLTIMVKHLQEVRLS